MLSLLLTNKGRGKDDIVLANEDKMIWNDTDVVQKFNDFWQPWTA